MNDGATEADSPDIIRGNPQTPLRFGQYPSVRISQYSPDNEPQSHPLRPDEYRQDQTSKRF